MSAGEALDELARCAGTQFDPEVVRVLPPPRGGRALVRVRTVSAVGE